MFKTSKRLHCGTLSKIYSVDAYHSRQRYSRTSAGTLSIEGTAPGFDNRTSEHDKIRSISLNDDSHSQFYS